MEEQRIEGEYLVTYRDGKEVCREIAPRPGQEQAQAIRQQLAAIDAATMPRTLRESMLALLADKAPAYLLQKDQEAQQLRAQLAALGAGNGA